MKKYDALIIGFGKGGKTLAAALGKKGIKTAVIEKISADVRRYLHKHRLYSYKKTHPYCS